MGANYVEALAGVKAAKDHNPLYTQEYSADPYALIYQGRVYLYMTGDKRMYEEDGSIRTNNYSNINTLRVISSEDLVNWTDHGEVYAAGQNGAANWGNNSWAPAACVKKVDGKDRFFLYFANSGNGIAVVSSDSPTGPFTDPIGKPLVSRETPTCAEVTWLFDPAVLVDEDGCGYLYFGGGIPCAEKIPNPGTARVAKLADDMIHLDGDPIPIPDVLYLFEDSGINKVNGQYIYSYCSNFNVPAGGCEGYGFESGEIITMKSTTPMGPFEMIGGVLKNPGYFFKNGGNNHHCMFCFQGKWYVTYHASLIEEAMGLSKGYRSVNIDEITINEKGEFAPTKATKAGVAQVKTFDPYRPVSFVTMSHQAGITTIPADAQTEKYGSGNRTLHVLEDGAYIQISGVDFKEAAEAVLVKVKGQAGSISVRIGSADGKDLGKVSFEGSEEVQEFTIELTEKISGVQDLFFVFEGKGMEPVEWKCN